MASDSINFGQRIQEYRKSAGLTLTELAERAQISTSMLSQIERGLANPSINTIRLISQALDTPLFLFFTEEGSMEDQFVHPDQRKHITAGGVDYELLTPDMNGALEACMLTLEPGTSTVNEPLSHDGEEVALVLEGEVELTLNDQRYRMHKGDSVRILPRARHSWYNCGQSLMQLIFVVTPPHF